MVLGNGMYVETTCHCMLKQSRGNVPFRVHFPPFKGLKEENSTTRACHGRSLVPGLRLELMCSTYTGLECKKLTFAASGYCELGFVCNSNEEY